MDWGHNKIVGVGPILSRLWTKVQEILDYVGEPFYLPSPLPDCSENIRC